MFSCTKSCLVISCCFSDANVHAQTGTGDTALTYACENGHTDVAELLLERGAELVSFLAITELTVTYSFNSVSTEI